MKKISFDFDGTLSETHILAVAIRAIEAGHDVYITTARFQHKAMAFINKDVYKVADLLGIVHDKVRFTDGNDKSNWLVGFDIHLDDCMITLAEIRDKNKEIKLLHVGEDRHIRDFDDFDYKIKTTPAGIIIP